VAEDQEATCKTAATSETSWRAAETSWSAAAASWRPAAAAASWRPAAAAASWRPAAAAQTQTLMLLNDLYTIEKWSASDTHSR